MKNYTVVVRVSCPDDNSYEDAVMTIQHAIDFTENDGMWPYGWTATAD